MPQPIDMQTEMARITMAERMQEAARAQLAAHQRAASEQDKLRVDMETAVHDTDESQNEHIDGEQKRRNPYSRLRKKKRKESGELRDPAASVFYTAADGKQIAEDPEDHGLDVTV